MSNDYGSTRSSSGSDHLNSGKENNANTMDLSRKLSDDEMPTPSKRFLSEDEKYSSFGSVNNSTNIKIATNKGECRFVFADGLPASDCRQQFVGQLVCGQ